MSLSDLSSIVGVISGLAVLGSLIYLAQQTRQNFKHTRALIFQGTAELALSQFHALAEPELATAIIIGNGGTPTHVGEGPGGASALDCAALANSMLSIVGLLQGIELCRSESVDPAILVGITNGTYAVWPEVNKMMLQAVAAGSYANPQASIDTWAATARHISDIVARNRMEPLVSDMLGTIFDRAHATGLGNLDIAALAEILRARQSQ
jgi:3-hydroxyisobutyrate dehydrogenase-like beta-hydroxyacid dehydrogenase